MATNEILPFAATSTNILSQPAYDADPQRLIGHQPGIARDVLENKALKQASLMSAGLAQFVADKQANNITDTLTPAQIAEYLANAIEAGAQNVAVAGGTADALTAVYTPAKTSLGNGDTFLVRAATANLTTTPTLEVDALAAKAIVKGSNSALVAGDIAGAGHWLDLQYDSVLDRFILQNPAKGINVAVAPAPAQLQNITATVNANSLTINYAGGTLDFRSDTLSNGAPISGVIVPALSIVIPDTATMGAVNGITQRIYVEVAYNGGTPVLCASGMKGLNLDETTLISPTTVSAASDLDSVIYSSSAVSSNSPFRVVGFLDIVQAVAGTWATPPTLVQPIGGAALDSLSSIGFGQTWQTVTRTSGTTYYNTTGKPISLAFTAAGTSGVFCSVSITFDSGVPLLWSSGNPPAGITGRVNGYAVIPNRSSYVITDASITSRTTYELR